MGGTSKSQRARSLVRSSGLLPPPPPTTDVGVAGEERSLFHAATRRRRVCVCTASVWNCRYRSENSVRRERFRRSERVSHSLGFLNAGTFELSTCTGRERKSLGGGGSSTSRACFRQRTAKRRHCGTAATNKRTDIAVYRHELLLARVAVLGRGAEGMRLSLHKPQFDCVSGRWVLREQPDCLLLAREIANAGQEANECATGFASGALPHLEQRAAGL